MSPDILFCLLLFIVAFLYASIGHGGASGYLALMALFSFSPEVMKPSALLLNLFVSLIAFIQYYRTGNFNWKVFIPFAVASIPFAFWGGVLKIDPLLYKRMLGLILLIPAIRFILYKKHAEIIEKKQHAGISFIIGGSIGFMSGLIGIGGGVILTPVLLLLKWCDMKKAAGISALFIFVNSLSGMGGQLMKGVQFSSNILLYVGIAFTGGMVGSYLGSKKLNNTVLLYLLSLTLMMASYKLLFTAA
ncbi:MAG: sulfite exporter TauE/SafE family protein [Ferruginibacter sp.]|nr:sulfite exporter TauE/SafE family protein [Ferruginibacter sp.]